jgi:hypothetical protein
MLGQLFLPLIFFTRVPTLVHTQTSQVEAGHGAAALPEPVALKLNQLIADGHLKPEHVQHTLRAAFSASSVDKVGDALTEHKPALVLLAHTHARVHTHTHTHTANGCRSLVHSRFILRVSSDNPVRAPIHPCLHAYVSRPT